MIFTIEQALNHYQYSRRLSLALRKVLPANKAVLDVGCCKGEYLYSLSQASFRCIGYEGTEGINSISRFKGIKSLDLSEPLPKLGKNKKRQTGSVVCLDTIEHISKKNEATVVNNLANLCSSRLVISWNCEHNEIGSANERDGNYIIPLFEKKGFILNLPVSQKLRTEGGADFKMYKNSIYVFDKA